MQGDYAELVFEVKNINKTIRDIVKVRKEIEKTGKETKNLQDTLVSGWSFGKVFQAMQKFGDAFRDVQITMKSFSSIYGTFNAQADEGVKMLIKDFQETERSAKKLLNLIGSRTINLGLDTGEVTKMNVELARITEEVAAFTGKNIDEVGKKLSQSLAGEVGGLKDLGIVINSSSQAFKDAVKGLQDTGISKEAATAMVVYEQIRKQAKQFDGSFKAGAKSITQAFGNIQNTLTSGVFAKAGEKLSQWLLPLLNKVDEFLGNDIVQHLGSITLAIGSLTVAVLLLKKAVGGFSEFIGLSGLISKGGGLLAKLAPGLTKAIMGLLPVLSSALAGLGSALVALLPVILTAALAAGLTVALFKTVQLIKQKGFVGAAKAIGEWFMGLGESIVNWLKGKGFKSNKEVKEIEEDLNVQKFAKHLDELKEDLNKNIDKINEVYAEFNASFNKNAGVGLYIKDTDVTADEIKKNLVQSLEQVTKSLEDNGELLEDVGTMQDGLYNVSRSALTEMTIKGKDSTEFKNEMYDAIANVYANYADELKQLGLSPEKFTQFIDAKTKQFKKRIGENGETLIKEQDINNLFSSEVFTQDYFKLREFILKKYNEEMKKWKFVKSQANRAGAPNVKVPGDAEVRKMMGVDHTLEYFATFSKEVFEDVWSKLPEKSFSTLKDLISKYQSDYKKIFEDIKSKYDAKEWKLDVKGLDLDKFKDLTKDIKFRTQLAELINAIGKNAIKNAEGTQKTIDEFWKNRQKFKEAIDRETTALKNWRRDKWQIIENSLNMINEFSIPGVDNLEDRLKSQKDKIAEFRKIFNVDLLMKNYEMPDVVNAKKLFEKKVQDTLALPQKSLAKILNVKIDELGGLSKDEIRKRVEKALATEKARFEGEEEMWKRSFDQYSDKEKIALLKELQQMYLDKFHIEMEGLEKERQYIEDTNNFIKESLSKALEWSPQGISAIQSNTMEGYKFMTSGFKDLGNFSSVINQKNNEEAVLQKQTNELIKGTKTILDTINNRLNELLGNAPTLTFVN